MKQETTARKKKKNGTKTYPVPVGTGIIIAVFSIFIFILLFSGMVFLGSRISPPKKRGPISEIIIDEREGEIFMVYTKGSELRLLTTDGVSIKIEDLENPYTAEELTNPSYPKFSPDGANILYTSGLNLKIYNIVNETTETLYTGREQGIEGDTVYKILQ